MAKFSSICPHCLGYIDINMRNYLFLNIHIQLLTIHQQIEVEQNGRYFADDAFYWFCLNGHSSYLVYLGKNITL